MIKKQNYLALISWFILLLTLPSCHDQAITSSDKLQLTKASIGSQSILNNTAEIILLDEKIVLFFSHDLDANTITTIQIVDNNNTNISAAVEIGTFNNELNISPNQVLEKGKNYTIAVPNTLKGILGETFDGIELNFRTKAEVVLIDSISIGSKNLLVGKRNIDIPLNPIVDIFFNIDFDVNKADGAVFVVGKENYLFDFKKVSAGHFQIILQKSLAPFSKINLLITSKLGEQLAKEFKTVSYELYTQLGDENKFPLISDEELMTLVQGQTFKYFWNFGHPVSGLARERNSSGDLVTIGGSGFGLMSMIVAVERGFISRDEALTRWEKIFNFLEKADRFHGVWSHWLSGSTGKVIPFSQKDNGGDLVETAFLAEGMITVRQYLDPNISREQNLINKINELWNGIEWDWYTKGTEKALYWHWSPNYGWDLNHRISGHNETQIAYILAASSQNHSIDKEVYTTGYARDGGIINKNTYYGYQLPLGSSLGGPLFFTHYSYIGLDPRNLKDQYANYWEQNVNHSKINHAYCEANPSKFVGYSADCWGLTASDNESGYSAHSPTNDRGVITPTASLSSMPYTPKESLAAMKLFYYKLGDRLWGEYGFYDAFNPTADWYASSTLAIDQGPIICMIENHRTGLLWSLFMSAPEVKDGLTKLGFTY